MNSFYSINKKYIKTILGILLINISISILFSFFSFLLYYNHINNKLFNNNNILGFIGYNISYFAIYKGLGISMFILPIILFFLGMNNLFLYPINYKKFFLFNSIYIPINILLGISLISLNKVLIGELGILINKLLIYFIGYFGLFMFISTNIIIYIIFIFRITPENLILIEKYYIIVINYIKKIFNLLKKRYDIYYIKKIKFNNQYIYKKKSI